ncbi:riboflavin biosynthesis protein RibD [Candidatus Velamenicoccus archaeovorus]|uniref:Riboflavin biosynthesis protein RibD n=1 Tax=Velamenicoccus archaeovorus TaxID=1930593 RepID=A0A410P5E4_VELA1|nr:bifunctional diaminohydroxyphosphoribosylaminopyrimidine deaminase/5-amino-6-(5-phosphoribosylamino)uracil reductase RibD [Candidatus Velamenicoccus archaeovorus]QAT17291.1 riboflavin biosynthesis protein RibD [Candidatus Velamenicoccus archaeovorus]
MQAQVLNAYMRRALELAARARGKTFPNPLVGAVVVKNGHVVGEGFHHKAGAPHAEVLALKEASGKARGAALFCTFEPCFHFGRTAPCVDAVISSGIREVYIGSKDPNPLTCGKSIRLLRRRGIRVAVGIMKKEVFRLNEPFFCAMRRQRPLVTLKVAASLDGKIATRSGRSQWITSRAARRHAHNMRKYYDAIMVGIGTVLKDDPGLEAGGGHRLTKIVVDSSLRLPLSARLLKTRQPVVVATATHNKVKEKALLMRGVKVLHTKRNSGGVDLADLLRRLHAMDIRHLLVEGGAALTGAFLDARLADKIVFYWAPLIIGGRQALGALGGRGVDTPQKAVSLKRMTMERIGRDFLIEGELVYS